MKKITSIVLIVAFFAQSTSQLWILSAFYINRDYIAANLCINRFDKIPVCKGACYLEKQINENNKQQQEKIPELKLKEITLFCQSTDTPMPDIVCNTLSAGYPSCDGPTLSSHFLHSVFHPPQA